MSGVSEPERARAAVRSSRRSLALHSKSFALAGKLLPRACRDDAAAVYAWCRRADDAIDQPSAEGPERALTRLTGELDALYAGAEPEDLDLFAFAGVVRRRRIPIEYPRALLAGMAMDTGAVAYTSVAELLTYCFRVAGTVGLMMCHVLGVRHAHALRHAADLGIGMQLTNICRDVYEDWQRGRRYLPRELFVGSLTALELNPVRSELTPELAARCRPAVRELLRLAAEYYASGDHGLTYLAPRAAFAVRTARLVYSSIGVQLERMGHDVLAGRAVVSTASKLGLCLSAGVSTLVHPGAHGRRFEPAELQDSVSHVRNAFPL
jgi:15-cis-phytoene synthase